MYIIYIYIVTALDYDTVYDHMIWYETVQLT